MEKNLTWAKKLIATLQKAELDDSSDAIRHFVSAYDRDDDDEVAALYAYEASAAEVHDTTEVYSGMPYSFYIFADGSVYYDALAGIDKFFPSLSDLADYEAAFKSFC